MCLAGFSVPNSLRRKSCTFPGCQLLMRVLHGERNMKASNDNKTPARPPFVGGNYVPCTIKDIAKKVGVSTATVSRVMNGNENVSCETRTAVQSAISRLRYSPNSHAAALGRSNGHGPRKRRIQASKSAQAGAKLLTAQQADAQKGSRKSERPYSLDEENSRLRELVNNLRKELERWRASTDGDNRPKTVGGVQRAKKQIGKHVSG
jgi:transcriptional regulator with XRE-family HTH domain